MTPTKPGRVTPADIEAKLRQLRGEIESSTAGAKDVGVMVAAAAVGAVSLLAYLLGWRRGRRKSTVVEIRRV
jgi:hypothetical protein